jgi:hypothetical protein
MKSVLVATVLATAVCLVLGVAGSLAAHHAHPPGVFNDTFSEVKGSVKEVRWGPPHVWVMLEVKSADGETQLWPLEAASPSVLQSMGLTSSYLKVGDTITARCRRLRVVEKGKDNDCILGFLKGSDGRARDWSGNNAAVPADF